ncbi:MAG: M90 family metallopeptidase [Planctomycetota bacterium]|nr:M90 family metallopeptidase [Planctomycetota bacterium]
MGFISRWRRSKLKRLSISQSDLTMLKHSLWQATYLPPNLQEQLIRWARLLIFDKFWEGCDGLSVSKEMQWKVSAQAGLMVVGYPDWHFDKTATVLIYPRPYVARDSPVLLGGYTVGIEGESVRAGETGYRKPVILNWNDVQLGARDANDGHNLVIHEFAHQLDLINGPSADGLPPLPHNVDEVKWWESMKAELQAARAIVADGYRVLIGDYGLSEPSEFFAVSSELYFQQPHLLAEYHPTVYELLQIFYQIDLREYVPKQT